MYAVRTLLAHVPVKICKRFGLMGSLFLIFFFLAINKESWKETWRDKQERERERERDFVLHISTGYNKNNLAELVSL